MYRAWISSDDDVQVIDHGSSSAPRLQHAVSDLRFPGHPGPELGIERFVDTRSRHPGREVCGQSTGAGRLPSEADRP